MIPNLVIYNNKHVWFQQILWVRNSFPPSLMRLQPRCWLGLQSSEDLTHWTNHFQDSSLTQMLVGAIGSLLWGPLYNLLNVVTTCYWLSPEQGNQERTKVKTTMSFRMYTWKLYSGISKISYRLHRSAYLMWEETTQVYDHQESGIIGGMVQARNRVPPLNL